MTFFSSLLDLAVSVGLVLLAWRALVSPSLYRAMILFIVFGLIMALAWSRLAAPDIALAEAAIGAGITGALLLSTRDTISGRPKTEADETTDNDP